MMPLKAETDAKDAENISGTVELTWVRRRCNSKFVGKIVGFASDGRHQIEVIL